MKNYREEAELAEALTVALAPYVDLPDTAENRALIEQVRAQVRAKWDAEWDYYGSPVGGVPGKPYLGPNNFRPKKT